jgi:hypothetical protein
MIPDLDDVGGTFTQGFIRIVLFVLVILLGGLLGALADFSADLIDSWIHPGMTGSPGTFYIISNAGGEAMKCSLSSAFPLYLLVIVAVVFDLGFFRCCCVTLAMTVLISLYLNKSDLGWIIGLILLGMVTWSTVWLRHWRRNRWAVEMAMLQAENAQRRAELESRGIATFDREPDE